jgi:hypothetical protein
VKGTGLKGGGGAQGVGAGDINWRSHICLQGCGYAFQDVFFFKVANGSVFSLVKSENNWPKVKKE